MKLKAPSLILMFNLCLTALFLYSVLPLFIPPATLEGFEAYVTNGINHNINPLFSSIAFPYYNISNRLGEFLCYITVCKLFSIDARAAAWYVNAVSYVCYLLLATLAIRKKFSVSFSAILFGLLLFPDTTAVASQTSSCLLALPWVSACFLAISYRFPFNTVVAAVMLTIASVFRIDTLGVMPFIFAWYTLENEKRVRAQVKSLTPFILVPFAVWAVYKLKGYDIVREVKTATAPLPANWPAMFVMVSCFFSIPAILLSGYGFMTKVAGVLRKEGSALRRAHEVVVSMALFYGPLLLWMYLYRTKPETPRFLIVTSFFLAISVSIGISNLLELRSKITKSVAILSLLFITLISVFWRDAQIVALSDGSRLKYLNMGLPYYYYMQKQTLSDQVEDLDKLLFSDRLAMPERTFVVITSWRLFNEVNRFLVDKDYRLVDADPSVLSIIKKFPRPLGNFTFKNRQGKEIVILLCEAVRDFSPANPATVYDDVIAPLRGGHGKIILLSVYDYLTAAAPKYGAQELICIEANARYVPIHNGLHVILCD
uniref:Uncharacterized protein n=1 Tax=Geobacter sp. (strain M21) TaxID=443144 RepID=C6E5W0_GEOSM